MTGIVERPISADEVSKAVGSCEAGAIVTMLGTVRKKGGIEADVEYIEYEADKDLAEQRLKGIAAGVEASIPGCRVAALHRVGRVNLGEAAVAIAASHAHRREAFRACELTIDRMKKELPVWKKEFGGGKSGWVGHGV